MHLNSEHPDYNILKLLPHDREGAIELLFRKYYAFLCKAIHRIIPDEAISEDLAQEVFYELWRKKDGLNIKTSIKAYLRRAGINKALNHIRDKKIRWESDEKTLPLKSQIISASKKMEVEEMKGAIDKAIDSLPERCRLVFVLSRFEEMTYQEIADELEISIKTVENQISKALKILRKALANYLQDDL